MKTESEVKACASASCKQAIKLAMQIGQDMAKIGVGGEPKETMPRIRANLAELNQRIHEFNAFDNTLLPTPEKP